MHEAALAHRVILRAMAAIPRYLAALSPAAWTQLRARWSEPCEAMFEFLAANYPQDLLKVVSATVLAAPVLTFAAEIAGRTVRTPAVRTALAPLVREGAIYGLRDHADEAIVERLRSMARGDRSPAIRRAASDTLADL